MYIRQIFYNRKKLYEKYGDGGLKFKKPSKPNMPNKIPLWIVSEIMDYIKGKPTYGPQRIQDDMRIISKAEIKISHSGVWEV